MYDLYNKEAFEGCLPIDMEINWDSRLTKTAGTCTQAGKLDRKTGAYTERKSSINLSIKVNNLVFGTFKVFIIIPSSYLPIYQHCLKSSGS